MPEQHADQDPVEPTGSDEATVRPNRADRRNKGKTAAKANQPGYHPHIKTASAGHQRQYSNRRSGG
jgi:hypothetical protein